MGTATLPAPQVRRIAANIGMLVCLASLAMVFVTLLFSYGVIRTKSAVWPPLDAPALPVGLAWLNTAVLLLSSAVFHRGQQRVQQGDQPAFTRFLLGTFALGLVFLGLQTLLWTRIHADGLRLSGSLYGAWLYFLTVFHAAHILAGLAVVGALLPAALRQRLYPDALTRVHLSGMFWHFLGVAWLAIFVVLFLL